MALITERPDFDSDNDPGEVPEICLSAILDSSYGSLINNLTPTTNLARLAIYYGNYYRGGSGDL